MFIKFDSWKCGGSLLAHQIANSAVPGSNQLVTQKNTIKINREEPPRKIVSIDWFTVFTSTGSCRVHKSGGWAGHLPPWPRHLDHGQLWQHQPAGGAQRAAHPSRYHTHHWSVQWQGGCTAQCARVLLQWKYNTAEYKRHKDNTSGRRHEKCLLYFAGNRH